jgi:NifU-like protein involved in Fe-S cluster formation
MTSSGLENVFGYGDGIWQRFSRPAHAGMFADDEVGVIRAQATTPGGRQVLSLQLKLEREIVADSRFRAYGCPTAIAVGEWLAQRAIGRGVLDLGAVSVAQIRAELEIPDDRAHCALLGQDVLQALIKEVASS